MHVHNRPVYRGERAIYSGKRPIYRGKRPTKEPYNHDNEWLEAEPSVVERWGAGVETQKNVRGEIGGWGRVPFDEPYAPSLSTIYDGA